MHLRLSDTLILMAHMMSISDSTIVNVILSRAAYSTLLPSRYDTSLVRCVNLGRNAVEPCSTRDLPPAGPAVETTGHRPASRQAISRKLIKRAIAELGR
mgnify:FL=1|jgi:hypothetical protein